jgi:hypothetical protein
MRAVELRAAEEAGLQMWLDEQAQESEDDE